MPGGQFLALAACCTLLLAWAAIKLPTGSTQDRQGNSIAQDAYCGMSTRKGRRAQMEDHACCLTLKNKQLNTAVNAHGVFDGHEGGNASKFAADHLEAELARQLQAVARAASNRSATELLQAVLQAALSNIDSKYSHLTTNGGQPTDGSTATVVLVADQVVVAANIGDSRALLCQPADTAPHSTGHRQPLVAVPLTQDHSPGRADELERIRAAGGRVDPPAVAGGRWRLQGELAVSRSLGDYAYRRFGLTADPEFTSAALTQPGLLVLATDGVFEVMTPQQVCDLLQAGSAGALPPPAASAAIALLPVDAGGVSATEARFGSSSFDSDHVDSAGCPAGGCDAVPAHQPGSSAAADGSRHHSPQQVPAVHAAAVPAAGNCDFPGCVDCCAHAGVGSAGQPRPVPLAQALAELVQQQAYELGSTDNIAVLVAPLPGPAASTAGTGTLGVATAGLQPAGSTDDAPLSTAAADAAAAKNAVAAGATGALLGLRVAHHDSAHQYELVERLALVPRPPEAGHLHDSQQQRGWPQAWRVHDALAQHASLQRTPDWPDALCAQPAPADVALAVAQGRQLDLVFQPTCPPGQASNALSVHLPPELPDISIYTALADLPLQPADEDDALERGRLSAPWSGSLPAGGASAHAHYELASQFARGGFGEVWRARRTAAPATKPAGKPGAGRADQVEFVLKRMMGEKGPDVRLSGLREVYFGNLLHAATRVQTCGQDASACAAGAGYDHLVQFEESFEVAGDLWLVFRNAGISLHSLMYSPAGAPAAASKPDRRPAAALDAAPGAQDAPGNAAGPTGQGSGSSSDAGSGELQVLAPSGWWWRLRRSGQGEEVVRDLLRQLLLALAAVHAANVTHRDVKPENLLVVPDPAGGPFMHLRLIDFGSAIDPYSLQHLYARSGPSQDQQTPEYAPPEALLGRYWAGEAAARRTWPYDMWSAGVVWLELLLATPAVFQIAERTRARLAHHLHLADKPPAEQAAAYLLRGLMELCIYPPRPAPATAAPSPRQAPDAGAGASAPVETSHAASQAAAGQRAAGSQAGQGPAPVSWSCTEEALLGVLRARDPVRRGLPGAGALRLLQALLHWDPARRPTAVQALLHAYFVGERPGMPCTVLDRAQAGWC